MKIDLFMLRKSLKKTQKEMAEMFHISRQKYCNAEQMDWIEDRYIYEMVKRGDRFIVPPHDFFEYTSYSLILNITIKNLIALQHDDSKRLTQNDIAKCMAISQPYISIITSKFVCLYDRKTQLDRLFAPYFQPFIELIDKPGYYVHYINDKYIDQYGEIIQADQKHQFSAAAILYNLKMTGRSKRSLALYLHMSISEFDTKIHDNYDFVAFEKELLEYFPRFLVPFYKEQGRYHMLEASVDVAAVSNMRCN